MLKRKSWLIHSNISGVGRNYLAGFHPVSTIRFFSWLNSATVRYYVQAAATQNDLTTLALVRPAKSAVTGST